MENPVGLTKISSNEDFIIHFSVLAMIGKYRFWLFLSSVLVCLAPKDEVQLCKPSDSAAHNLFVPYYFWEKIERLGDDLDEKTPLSFSGHKCKVIKPSLIWRHGTLPDVTSWDDVI